MSDDAPVRLDHPGAERVRCRDEETQIVGKARRVSVDTVNCVGKALACIEIVFSPDPQLHGNRLAPARRGIPVLRRPLGCGYPSLNVDFG